MAIPKSLLGKTATRNNLEEAWHDVSRLARPLSHGLSEQTINDFRSNYKGELEIIRSQLLGGTYCFGNLRGVTIKKKNSNKRRPLKIADIRDRVVQRAMTRVMEKYLKKSFGLENPASFAYVRKKGVRTAILQMLKYHQEGCNIIFEADIVDFFGTVNVDKLIEEMIFPALPDDSLNQLIQDAFRMEIGNKDNLPEEDWELYPESAAGLPQGGFLSPLFSNVYLAQFDHEMLKAGYRLIRYADDFIVMCKSSEEAENAFQLASAILANLGLRLHLRDDASKNAKTRIVKVTQTPISFLGIQFSGTRIWPIPEKRVEFSNKLSGMLKSAKTVRMLLISTEHLLEGWIAAYGFTDLGTQDILELDKEINKNLWRNLNQLKWRLTPKPISDVQRLNSGVGLASWYLNIVRGNMRDEERELFSKYWSKPN